jgi:hypothetical protein
MLFHRGTKGLRSKLRLWCRPVLLDTVVLRHGSWGAGAHYQAAILTLGPVTPYHGTAEIQSASL